MAGPGIQRMGAWSRTRPSKWGQARMGLNQGGNGMWVKILAYARVFFTNTYAFQNPCSRRGWVTWSRRPVLKHFQLAQVAGFNMRDLTNVGCHTMLQKLRA